MSADAAQRVRETAAAIYRAESRRVFVTLVRLLGDFELAEEALHDAFRAALEQWPRDGVPAVGLALSSHEGRAHQRDDRAERRAPMLAMAPAPIA
jgi:RNA polymerase sigma-70 factor (ECF subfamily)